MYQGLDGNSGFAAGLANALEGLNATFLRLKQEKEAKIQMMLPVMQRQAEAAAKGGDTQGAIAGYNKYDSAMAELFGGMYESNPMQAPAKPTNEALFTGAKDRLQPAGVNDVTDYSRKNPAEYSAVLDVVRGAEQGKLDTDARRQVMRRFGHTGGYGNPQDIGGQIITRFTDELGNVIPEKTITQAKTLTPDAIARGQEHKEEFTYRKQHDKDLLAHDTDMADKREAGDDRRANAHNKASILTSLISHAYDSDNDAKALGMKDYTAVGTKLNQFQGADKQWLGERDAHVDAAVKQFLVIAAKAKGVGPEAVEAGKVLKKIILDATGDENTDVGVYAQLLRRKSGQEFGGLHPRPTMDMYGLSAQDKADFDKGAGAFVGRYGSQGADSPLKKMLATGLAEFYGGTETQDEAAHRARHGGGGAASKDHAVPVGTPVPMASGAQGGIITGVYSDAKSGNYVTFKDVQTGTEIGVMHLDKVSPEVRASIGKVVPQGFVLGTAGRTGNVQAQPGQAIIHTQKMSGTKGQHDIADYEQQVLPNVAKRLARLKGGK